MPERPPLTPDFYEYRWLPPSSVLHEGHFVHLRWSDGAELTAYDEWLLENAVGTGIDPATREGLIDPADLDGSTRIETVQLRPDGCVVIDFASGPSGVEYHPGWLHHVARGAHRADAWLPPREPWTTTSLSEPPTHDGPAALDDPTRFGDFLEDLVRWGIARLENLSNDPDIALEVARRIGPVRNTNFGTIWDVRADVTLAGSAETNSTANSTLRLGPHTDLPTRETPPGHQVLHCLVNDTRGGWSTMADGLAVVAHLRDEHPDAYEALTTLRWVFFNRGPGIDHRWSGPLIDLGAPGTPMSLRAFYPVRGFPDMAPADIPRAYRALATFSRVAADPQFQLRYPFRAGDLVAFDNRRVLHGREAYESGGKRHLRGLYIDHDEILSAARVAARHRARSSC